LPEKTAIFSRILSSCSGTLGSPRTKKGHRNVDGQGSQRSNRDGSEAAQSVSGVSGAASGCEIPLLLVSRLTIDDAVRHTAYESRYSLRTRVSLVGARP
jgi:hypothetical protein